MMEELGTIETEVHGDVTVVGLVGEHDVTNAATLQRQLGALSGAGSTGGLVVSLMPTTFLDSSVVHTLFLADGQLRKRDRRLVLHVATASIVRRVLEVSGLAEAVACTGSLEAAIVLSRPALGDDPTLTT
jgi:anti-anti-sigma factor